MGLFMRRRVDYRGRGFTLIELLVAIAIIGILTTIAVVAMTRARSLAKETKAKADLREIRTAINMLVADTGKWPNGCRVDMISNPEVNLSAAQAGLVQVPTVGDQGDGCFWTSTDVASWRGPYVNLVTDPWGNNYYFDPDYTGYTNCSTKEDLPEMPTIVSFGPNEQRLNGYDCDDLFLTLR